MGRNTFFQFKQFTIIQEKSAMKVGTDGVLLGAWADVSGAETILDIGTGTGLIALMAAQRSHARIVGVEIEPDAFIEASRNVSMSPWKDRIQVINSSFQEFSQKTDLHFDLIIANPPFFENDKCSPDLLKSTAKHAVALTFDDLLHGIGSILSPDGRFCVILPVTRAIRFRKLASLEKLYLNRLTGVKANPEKNPHRWLMEFSFRMVRPQISELIIEENTPGKYTSQYIDLKRDFYIAF